jgi:thiol-disulfide isomerase/thioredoxin
VAAGWVLLVTAVTVAAVGLALRRRAGRVRTAPPGSARPLPAAVLAELAALAEPAEHAVTLLQLSTSFCAPCRQASAVLSDLAERTPGLRYVELDVTERPDLSGPLQVRSTPTTLAVAADGRELLRLVGVPRQNILLDALRPHLR